MVRKINAYQLNPELHAKLGQQIGSATKPDQILDILQREGYPLKEGTKAVLEAADRLFSNHASLPLLQKFTLNGQTYVLRYYLDVAPVGNVYPKEWNADPRERTSIYLSVVYGSGHNLPPMSGAFDTKLRYNEIAVRKWTPDFSQKGKVAISSVSSSRPNYGGQGFSLALGLLSNILIRDCMQRRMFKGCQKVKATIADLSNRLGWSTNLALMLGFGEPPKSSEPFYHDFESIFDVPADQQ